VHGNGGLLILPDGLAAREPEEAPALGHGPRSCKPLSGAVDLPRAAQLLNPAHR
jgi:hypothetical protein